MNRQAESRRADESRRSTTGPPGDGAGARRWGAVAAVARAPSVGGKRKATKLGANFATAGVLELTAKDKAAAAAEGRKADKHNKKPVHVELSEITALSGRTPGDKRGVCIG